MTLLESPIVAIRDALARFGSRVAIVEGLAGVTASVIADGHPDVVVFGPQVNVLESLLLVEELDRLHPEITMVVVAEPTPELLELAIEAGVRRIVRPDAPDLELERVVEELLARVDRQRANTVIDLREPEVRKPRGRVITVLSPKGGAGKTTVATNLAAGLAAVHPDEVVIMDLDLQFGDVADAYLLAPKVTLADLPAAHDVDGASVKLLLSQTGNGLYALCGHDDPATGEEVPVDSIARAIEELSYDMPFVVIDTGAGVDAPALVAAERSTDLLFVGSLDIPSIRSVQKLIKALDQLGITEPRRHVVLNRADSDVGITADEVAAALGLPITVELPSSRAVPAAMNLGAPVITSDPTSPIGVALQQVVASFTDVPVRTARRRFRRK